MARHATDPAFDRDLVRAAMKELKFTQTQLAKEMGLAQSAVANILSGERQVKAHEASYIYRRFGLDREADIQWAPRIGMSNAGNWREAIVHPTGRVPMPRGLGGERCFAIEVSGGSMNKLIQDGETVVVDPDQTQLYNDKTYLIENADHETQIKLYRSNPARFEPFSDEDGHSTLMVGEHQIHVVGRVVWRGGAL